MSINTDAFAYSDGELGSVSGGLWIQMETSGSGQNARANVSSGKVGVGAAVIYNATYMYNATYASASVYSQAVFDTLGANWDLGLMVNLQQSGSGTYDGYLLACYDTGGGNNNIEIYRVTDNISTSVQLGTTATTVISAGDTLKIANESGVLKAYRNGTLISGPGGADSTYTAATAGISPDGAAGHGARLDNWEGGDVGGDLNALIGEPQCGSSTLN